MHGRLQKCFTVNEHVCVYAWGHWNKVYTDFVNILEYIIAEVQEPRVKCYVN